MRMAPRRRRLGHRPVDGAGGAAVCPERLIVDDLRALGRWLARRDWVARRGLVGRLSPYPALLCLCAAGAGDLPVKLLAVARLSQGHVLAGVGAAGGQGGRHAGGHADLPRGRAGAAQPGLVCQVRATPLHWRKVVYDSVRQQSAWRLARVQWRTWRRRLRGWRQQEASGDGWAAIRRRLRQLNG